MTIQEIKNKIAHRPWELPNTKWKFYQEWNQAIFLHWKVEDEVLKNLVPKELEIDKFEGSSWVSLVAFTMEKIRPRYLPHFPLISNFEEINIRTYVKYNNKTGVYFLSIEGGKRLSCKIAKSMSELPYRYSKMIRKMNNYESKNYNFGDSFILTYKKGKEIIEKSELDIWLTERYALFQDAEDFINEFEIHHHEWELNNLEIDKLELNYPRFKNLINTQPNKLTYSKGVKVIAWDKIKNRIE